MGGRKCRVIRNGAGLTAPRDAPLIKLTSARAVAERKIGRKTGFRNSSTGIAAQLYKVLALTYFRLGDVQNADEAARQSRLLDPDGADYVLQSAIEWTANRKEETAVALIEGFMVTHNRDLLPRLKQRCMQNGLDAKGMRVRPNSQRAES